MTSLRKLFTTTPKTLLLSLFFFLLPWQTRYIFGYDAEDATSQFLVLSVYATELLLIGIAVMTFLRKQDRPQLGKEYRVPIVLALAVFGYTLLSVMWSDYRSFALVQAFHVGCAMLAFILLLDRKLDLRPIGLAFAIGLIPPSLLGLWQVLFDSSGASTSLGLAARNAQTLGDAVTAGEGPRELRAYGSFPHPNIFGGYLAVGVLSLRMLWHRGMQNRVLHWVLLGTMLFMTFSLMLTASRSAVLGLLLGIGLVGLVSRMKNTQLARVLVVPIAVAVIGSAVAATLWASNLIAAIRGGGALEIRALTERQEQYGEWLAVMNDADAWLLGTGIGQYVRELMWYVPKEVWAYQPIHNVPLLIVAELGVVGALLVISWSSSIDRINFARFPNRDALMAFAMGNVVLVILFFDHYIWSTWAGLALIAYVMALTVRLGEKS